VLKVGSSFALLSVSLVDGRGGPAVDDQAVVVRDGRIVAVTPMAH
jgi:hypothetical protein